MSKAEQDDIVKNLKSCISSSKGGIPISAISRDYHMLIGDPLPYRGLGFSKVEDLIQSIPDLKVVKGPKGEQVVQIVPSKRQRNDQQARLIAVQKSANGGRFVPRAARKPNDHTTEEQQRKPNIKETNWRTGGSNVPQREVRSPALLRQLSQPQQNTNGRRSSQENNREGIPHSSKNLTWRRPSPDDDQSSQTATNHGGLRKPKRVETNNNNEELLYTPVVCPVASIRNPYEPPAAEIVATQHISTLRNYVAKQKLGEIEFKTIEMAIEFSKMYVSSVTIGQDFKLSTYPNGGSTAQEALDLVARMAYEALVEKNRKAAPQLQATTDSSEALQRILKLLLSHPNGMWSSKVPGEYSELYSEKLPDDWLKQIMAFPQVDANVISDKQIILTLIENPTVEDANTAPANDSVARQDDSPKGEETLANQVSQPPPITLPKEEHWDVYITNANSTTELWLRLVGDIYSVLYENLATEMELHYLGSKKAVEGSVKEGDFFALQLDDCVHRVQLQSIDNGMAQCLLLDHGQIETIAASELKVLEKQFLRLPFQAVQCELKGLEDFSNAEGVQELLLDTLIGKTFVAQPSPEFLEQQYQLDSQPVPLVLFDTSTSEDINVNTQLWEKIASTILTPKLPKEGKVIEVSVSYINSEANIFVQLYNSVIHGIQQKITLLDTEKLAGAKPVKLAKGKIYLAQYTDGIWYRATVTSANEKKAIVMFIDFGNTATVDVARLIDLESAMPDLAQIPPQAIMCTLHHLIPSPDVKVCKKTVERLTTLLPEDKPHLLKVICQASGSTPPAVEVFRRIEPDNLLVSVNSSISLDNDLFELKSEKKKEEKIIAPEKSAEKEKPVSPVRNLSLKTLPPPKIPEVGGYLDVIVVMAASPCNYIVQPYEHSNELQNLMVELQNLLGVDKGVKLQPGEVREGGVYAAKHHDGKWYRALVNNLLKGDHFASYLMDFGDHVVVSLDKLRVLPQNFCALPYQAVKAKLAGVKAINNDWRVEDCVRFQELVCNRPFVSVVEATGPDLINPSEMVLCLRLIDTSSDEDIDIAQVLINEKRATKAG
ncbi:tudor domain-containing protein 7B isoform X2 [Neocloeon triangulifer]|uniref:tudor domain-containing protein 7B isoform X2 n=1 Tax=Neocloeon triangulifer TaxID=2078957 RepID=UPI00286F69D5|nr:tudor domain-containing protein 7B isoform X2 [Neocloeon triangulifer]